MDRRQGKADLGNSDVYRPASSNLLEPVQRVGVRPRGILFRKLAFPDEFPLFHLTIDDAGSDANVFPGLTSRRQEPVDKRTENRRVKSEVTSSNESMDSIVDGNVQPLLVATDFLTQKHKRGQASYNMGNLLCKVEGEPFYSLLECRLSSMDVSHVPPVSGSLSFMTAAVSLESGVISCPARKSVFCLELFPPDHLTKSLSNLLIDHFKEYALVI